MLGPIEANLDTAAANAVQVMQQLSVTHCSQGLLIVGALGGAPPPPL